MTAPAIPRSTALVDAGREWGQLLTEADARALTAQIRTTVEQLLPLIRTAFQRRADEALGYASWEAYCDAELAGLRLAIADRQEAVTELRSDGMSQRAIGSALGISAATVNRTLATVSSETVPDRIEGLDGKDRPATAPKRTPTPGTAGAVQEPPAVPGTTPETDVHGVEAPGSGLTPAPVSAAPVPSREPDPQPPITPPPGSPATWTDEEREANRLEVQRKQAIAAAERFAKALVLEVRGMVTTIIDGLDCGAPGILVSLADIDECRAALDRLEARVMA